MRTELSVSNNVTFFLRSLQSAGHCVLVHEVLFEYEDWIVGTQNLFSLIPSQRILCVKSAKLGLRPFLCKWTDSFSQVPQKGGIIKAELQSYVFSNSLQLNPMCMPFIKEDVVLYRYSYAKFGNGGFWAAGVQTWVWERHISSSYTRNVRSFKRITHTESNITKILTWRPHAWCHGGIKWLLSIKKLC